MVVEEARQVRKVAVEGKVASKVEPEAEESVPGRAGQDSAAQEEDVASDALL